jgi:FkbM family methyltransferase
MNLINRIKNKFFFNKHKSISYSQEGEDLILERYFENVSTGFFIDIGAHHPKRFSNTFLLYKKGWRGINIDPMPGIMKLFNKIRPNDINLEIGISKIENILTYYIFNETALNTFNKEEANFKANLNPTKFFIERKIQINTYPLYLILDKYLINSNKIDLMTVDVEGLDMEVLASNDWSKYRPKIILVEELRTNINMLLSNSEIYNFLKSHNYSLHFRTYNTSFYIDSNI